jgi:hypothetical protein
MARLSSVINIYWWLVFRTGLEIETMQKCKKNRTLLLNLRILLLCGKYCVGKSEMNKELRTKINVAEEGKTKFCS